MSDSLKPPCPIWADDGTSGIAVWVNGGLVEITLAGFARLTLDEAADLPAAFTQAIDDARSWAARWDSASRTYTGGEPR